ncbi:MAG TPA: ATP-binding protein [Chthoniobacterales bacterium]|nr:ATP-binding protein [Chthoniobacterales bacterium]
MSDYNHELIGPAVSVLEAARRLAANAKRMALLLEGNPGNGKGHLGDELALELTGSIHAIERVNGQSLSVDLVRQWRERGAYGNLFSAWTVKRVDEIDQASSSAMAELLSFLDYQPNESAVIATTNEFPKLRALCKGRLESRFVRFHVDNPSVEETIAFLRRHYRLTTAQARAIAQGAVPDGCLTSEGCNLRTAINDAEGLTAAKKVRAA